MTFTELVTAVEDRLNLSSSDATARIGREINDRYKRVTSSIGLNTSRRSTVSKAATIGNRNLTFTGIEKISIVYDTSTGQDRVLDEVTYTELREATPEGEPPSRYAIANMGAQTVTIYLSCIPITTFTLFADGLALASTLSGSQLPAFPESYHDVLMHGVIADELRKLEKFALATEAENLYEKRLSELRYFIAKSGYLQIIQGGRGRVTAGGGGGGTTPVPGSIPVSALFGTANRVVTLNGAGQGAAALITNALVDNAAAIAYSKLNLTGGIVNADVAGAAAIAYSKLNLTGTIVNADISAAAQIAASKLVDGSALSVFGRTSNSVGVRTDMVAGTDGFVMRRVGTSIGFASEYIRLIDTQTGATNNWAISGLTGDAVILWNGAADVAVTGIVAGYNGQMLVFRNITAAKIMTFAHNSGSSSAGNKLSNIVTSAVTPVAPTGYAVFVYDATAAVWYLIDHEQGKWITPGFVAGDFTGNGSMTWTLAAGDRAAMSYRVTRSTIQVNFVLVTTTVGGTPNTTLKIGNGQWGGFTAGAFQIDQTLGFVIDNGVREAPGFLEVAAAGTSIGCIRYTAANWTAVADNAYVTGLATFELA